MDCELQVGLGRQERDKETSRDGEPDRDSGANQRFTTDSPGKWTGGIFPRAAHSSHFF